MKNWKSKRIPSFSCTHKAQRMENRVCLDQVYRITCKVGAAASWLRQAWRDKQRKRNYNTIMNCVCVCVWTNKASPLNHRMLLKKKLINFLQCAHFSDAILAPFFLSSVPNRDVFVCFFFSLLSALESVHFVHLEFIMHNFMREYRVFCRFSALRFI